MFLAVISIPSDRNEPSIPYLTTTARNKSTSVSTVVADFPDTATSRMQDAAGLTENSGEEVRKQNPSATEAAAAVGTLLKTSAFHQWLIAIVHGARDCP